MVMAFALIKSYWRTFHNKYHSLYQAIPYQGSEPHSKNKKKQTKKKQQQKTIKKTSLYDMEISQL